VKRARFANQSARPRRALARDRLAPIARPLAGASGRGLRGASKAPDRRGVQAPPPRGTTRIFASATTLPRRPYCRGPRRRSRHPAPVAGARGSTAAIIAGIFVTVLVRFGLLSTATMLFVVMTLVRAPLTLDASA